tara:strand:- start:96 stop:557 length:462 start_codon:yes stop_codon:yes gene_type:complete
MNTTYLDHLSKIEAFLESKPDRKISTSDYISLTALFKDLPNRWLQDLDKNEDMLQDNQNIDLKDTISPKAWNRKVTQLGGELPYRFAKNILGVNHHFISQDTDIFDLLDVQGRADKKYAANMVRVEAFIEYKIDIGMAKSPLICDIIKLIADS